MGVPIGAVKKVRLTFSANSCGLNAPRCADFIEHEKIYLTNYMVFSRSPFGYILRDSMRMIDTLKDVVYS